MINLFKKPDIVIQDYITNDMTDNSIQKSSKESNLNTEFIFLSDLNNFSNSSNQNKDFIPIAVSDEFAAATDIIKYGPHEFVVKDLSALNKLIAYFSHTHQTRLQTQYDLIGLGLFLATLILLIFGMFQKG